jgi:isoleucyl-tRNA synthetase
VLSTALFDKPPFKNVICAGLVLDKDGKKMAKRNGNCKKPNELIDKYGSDPLRMYLLGSPAVKANSLNFDEDGIVVAKQKLIQFQNGIKFFIEHYLSYTKSGHTLDRSKPSNNIFDQWILVKVKALIIAMRTKMDQFDIEQCPPLIYEFIEDFTNYYIKLGRARLRGTLGIVEWELSLSTTLNVILSVMKCFVPFMPFLSEYVYQHIHTLDTENMPSIHLCHYPTVTCGLTTAETQLLRNIDIFRNILTKARSVRSKNTHIASIRKPMKKLHIGHDDPVFLSFIEQFKDILCDEVNAMDVEINNFNKYISYTIKPNMKGFAMKYKKYMKNIKEILNIEQATLVAFYNTWTPITVQFNGEQLILTVDEIEVVPETSATQASNIVSTMENNLVVAIDVDRDDKMSERYIVRQFCMAVQNLRKKADIHPWDIINVYYKSSDKIEKILGDYNGEIQTRLKCHVLALETAKSGMVVEDSTIVSLDDEVVGNIMVYIDKVNA